MHTHTHMRRRNWDARAHTNINDTDGEMERTHTHAHTGALVRTRVRGREGKTRLTELRETRTVDAGGGFIYMYKPSIFYTIFRTLVFGCKKEEPRGDENLRMAKEITWVCLGS